MIVKPKMKGFLCATAHPEGCTKNVKSQIDYIKGNTKIKGSKKVLIIGSSTGFGIASRIVSTFACDAATIGIALERPAGRNKTASSGWYNTAAFETFAHDEGYYAKSIMGDAFSTEVKEKTIKLIKRDLGKVDLVIYSLAAPKRIHPITGEKYVSTLKPIGKVYKNKTMNFNTNKITTVEINPAVEKEIETTVKVMGGEDWEMWIAALKEANVLADHALTLAYSYIGPEITHSVYREGTIGMAKKHLEKTAEAISQQLSELNGRAYVSVNKALVTQASSAIPVVPLYISVLYRIMKEKGIHEGCIEQIYRLYKDILYTDHIKVDTEGRIHIDDWEMREDVQNEVKTIWDKIDDQTISELTDIEGYRSDFYNLFGFGYGDIDYDKEIDIDVRIPSIY